MNGKSFAVEFCRGLHCPDMFSKHLRTPHRVVDIEIVFDPVKGVSCGKLHFHIAAELLKKIFPFLIIQQLLQQGSGKHKTVCPIIQKFPNGKQDAPIVELMP